MGLRCIWIRFCGVFAFVWIQESVCTIDEVPEETIKFRHICSATVASSTSAPTGCVRALLEVDPSISYRIVRYWLRYYSYVTNVTAISKVHILIRASINQVDHLLLVCSVDYTSGTEVLHLLPASLTRFLKSHWICLAMRVSDFFLLVLDCYSTTLAMKS